MGQIAAVGQIEQIVESTALGLGYELVDCEVGQGGRALRIYIDKPGHVPLPGRSDGVSIEDCELLSRQLGRVLTVEGIDYDRLEVSSPGLDRVLKKPEEFRRFEGWRAEIRLRIAEQGRRRFTGMLRGASAAAFGLEVDGEVRSFAFANLDRARLAPKL